MSPVASAAFRVVHCRAAGYDWRFPTTTHMNNDPENQSDEAANRFETGKAHAKRAAEELRAAASAKAGELRERAGELRETASAKAQEWRDTATAKAGEWRDTAAARAEEWRGQAQDYYDTARDRARVIQDDSEAFVRENPTRSVLVAMGVGFVIGLLFRGGKR